MIANHIHDALRQVQNLKRKVIDSQRFTGYSGRARAIPGATALIAAAVMNSNRSPPPRTRTSPAGSAS